VSKCTTVPVAVCGRDVDGAFELVVGGELRHRVLVLDARSRVAGMCDPDGWLTWDPPALNGRLTPSPPAVQQALARSGRFEASTDERGVVVAIRVEPPRR